MEKIEIALTKLLFWIAVAGNSIFIAWMLYNGMVKGFKGTMVEKIAYVALFLLLALNNFLLLRRRVKANVSH